MIRLSFTVCILFFLLHGNGFAVELWKCETHNGAHVATTESKKNDLKKTYGCKTFRYVVLDVPANSKLGHQDVNVPAYVLEKPSGPLVLGTKSEIESMQKEAPGSKVLAITEPRELQSLKSSIRAQEKGRAEGKAGWSSAPGR